MRVKGAWLVCSLRQVPKPPYLPQGMLQDHDVMRLRMVRKGSTSQAHWLFRLSQIIVSLKQAYGGLALWAQLPGERGRLYADLH